MKKNIRILILEDRPADAELMLRELQRHGYEPAWKRIETEAEYLIQLDHDWEVILADYRLPQFTGLQALELLKGRGLDVPLIIVSGTIAEDQAVAAMKAGACDYVLKNNLARLGPAVEREVHEAAGRREHSQAMEALRQSEEKCRVVISTMQDGFWLLDHEGRILDVNEAYCRTTGYSREQLLTMRIPDVEAAESHEEVRRHLEKVIAIGSDRFETRHRCADGRLVELEVVVNHLPAGDGRLFALFRDISERKRIEEVLRQSEAKHRVLYEASRDAIMILEPPDWRFTAGNPATVVMFGARDEAEFTAKGPWEWSPEHQPDGRPSFEKAAEMIGKAMEAGSHLFEWTHRRFDGTQFPATVWLTRVELAGERFLQATVRDVSEQKKLEEQLLQSRKLDAVGQLAGGVAHDFNNILSVIISYSDFLLDELPEGSPLAADANEIKKSGQRAADLTRQLLAFSRKQQSIPRSVDVNEAIQGLSKMLGRLIGEHIRVLLDLSPGAGRIFVDPSQLESMIINLSVNARDAMTGGGTLTIGTSTAVIDAARAAAMGVPAPGTFAMITVSDTGTGMSDEVRRRIFEPFYTTKPQGKGTGLGLSTVYGVVTQNGGQIEVESAPGNGTTFRVYLKNFSGDAVAKTGDVIRKDVIKNKGACDGSILLVEDEDAVRHATARILRSGGYHVTEARNGEEAIVKYREPGACFDLVLTDMIMPGMGGMETSRQILALNPSQKFMYCSGYSDNMVHSQGLLGEGAVIIGKPIEKSELLRTTKEAIEG